MQVKCVWFIELPFKFDIKEDVKLNEIIIDDVFVLPVKKKNSKYYDSIKVEYKTDINEDLLPKDEYDSFRTLEFRDDVTKKVGVKVNRFVNSYCRLVEKRVINQIFNGDHFITYYQMIISDLSNRVVDGISSANGGVRVLDNNLLSRLIDDINTEEKNIVDEFMRLVHIPAYPDGDSGNIRTVNRNIRTPCRSI